MLSFAAQPISLSPLSPCLCLCLFPHTIQMTLEVSPPAGVDKWHQILSGELFVI